VSVLRLAGKWFSPLILGSYVDVQRRYFHLRERLSHVQGAYDCSCICTVHFEGLAIHCFQKCKNRLG